jgi:hypothetical protein
MRVLTHLDADSPGELAGDPAILDVDRATGVSLRRFLRSKAGGVRPTLSESFSWDHLLELLQQSAPAARQKVA